LASIRSAARTIVLMAAVAEGTVVRPGCEPELEPDDESSEPEWPPGAEFSAPLRGLDSCEPALSVERREPSEPDDLLEGDASLGCSPAEVCEGLVRSASPGPGVEVESAPRSVPLGFEASEPLSRLWPVGSSLADGGVGECSTTLLAPGPERAGGTNPSAAATVSPMLGAAGSSASPTGREDELEAVTRVDREEKLPFDELSVEATGRVEAGEVEGTPCGKRAANVCPSTLPVAARPC